MRHRFLTLSLAAAVLFLASITSRADELSVYTTNYPLQYFAERIAGDHAGVVFPAPAEADPAVWVPDQATIAAYQKADLILLNGATYEKWVSKVSLPRSRMVDTSRGFRDRFIIMEENVTHTHGSGGEHAHSNVAFTTWLDFTLAVEQAKAVAKALIRKKPGEKATFEKNLAALERDLMALDGELRKIAARTPSRPLVGSHPVYQYLARRYGLNLKSVHWEPDERPNEAQWRELKGLLKDHPARHIVWEGEPLGDIRTELGNLGLQSIVFAPCGNRPGDGDFLEVMRRNIANLDGAL
ncbi:MAG: metal ABC transporter substrate-binding protein [Candidatus Deferrimicrobiaceae bacterium]